MATVRASYKDESVESLIRKFRKKIEKEGTLFDMRKKDFYKSPATMKREKHEAAVKRAVKAARKYQKDDLSKKSK